MIQESLSLSTTGPSCACHVSRAKAGLSISLPLSLVRQHLHPPPLVSLPSPTAPDLRQEVGYAWRESALACWRDCLVSTSLQKAALKSTETKTCPVLKLDAFERKPTHATVSYPSQYTTRPSASHSLSPSLHLSLQSNQPTKPYIVAETRRLRSRQVPYITCAAS